MRKLLYNRWLVPTLLPGVLIALGIGVYEVTPPEPMCVIEAGSTQPVAFIEQGHRLLTYPSQNRFREGTGPFQIWDTRSGAEIARYFDNGFDHYDLTKDGRFLFAEVSKIDSVDAKPFRAVIRIELSNGGQTEFRNKEIDRTGVFSVSADGQFLLRVCNLDPFADFREDLPKTLRVYDIATGEVLKHCETAGGAGWDRNDNLVFFMPLDLNQANSPRFGEARN